jgi:hypothetical protein
MSIEHGTGALESKYDIRDYWYEPLARGFVDWTTSYDIEAVLGHRIAPKDQNGSGSCGGQAWAYYGAILEELASKSYEERSAKWIYSHTHAVPGGGSRGRDNCDFVIKTGWARESIVPSYDNGKPPSETFMITNVPVTPEIVSDTSNTRALSYLQVKPQIDLVAEAISDNSGAILLVRGEDNGTWRSQFPKPPAIGVWGHWIYAGRYKTINGKKYIGVLNSWGNNTGDRGWQWLGEDYFKSGFITEVWTMQYNYKPPVNKVILATIIDKLTTVVALLKQLKSLKK